MTTIQQLAWGGQPLDPIPAERTTDAAWFAQGVYLRELSLSGDEVEARATAMNRLRWRHAAELAAANSAIDALEGFDDE